MRRVVVLFLLGALATLGLTACMSDDESESAAGAQARRSAALVSTKTGGYQLVIDGITPSGQAIDVESWSWGVTNTASTTTAGKATMQDLSIVKTIDQTSPKLVEYVTTGKHAIRATLSLKKSGEIPFEYMTLVLEDVIVTSVRPGGSKANDIPLEEVSLAYRKMRQTFTPQTETGTAGTPTQFSWDLATATKY
jgi:type VI secretion system secreted protein Hcp